MVQDGEMRYALYPERCPEPAPGAVRDPGCSADLTGLKQKL